VATILTQHLVIDTCTSPCVTLTPDSDTTTLQAYCMCEKSHG